MSSAWSGGRSRRSSLASGKRGCLRMGQISDDTHPARLRRQRHRSERTTPAQPPPKGDERRRARSESRHSPEVAVDIDHHVDASGALSAVDGDVLKSPERNDGDAGSDSTGLVVQGRREWQRRSRREERQKSGTARRKDRDDVQIQSSAGVSRDGRSWRTRRPSFPARAPRRTLPWRDRGSCSRRSSCGPSP